MHTILSILGIFNLLSNHCIRVMLLVNSMRKGKLLNSAVMALTEGAEKRKSPLKSGLWCGDGQIRTADTRIFSPMLYQLSYITPLEWCKSR